MNFLSIERQVLNVIIELAHEEAIIPHRAHEDDAGFDLYSVESGIIRPGERRLIDTGIKVQLPKNTEMQVRPKSGIANKFGVTVLNTPGTVDRGFTSTVGVILINLGNTDFEFKPGMKIAQAIFNTLPEIILTQGIIDRNTDRGEGGFGSTGLEYKGEINNE